MGGAYLSLDQGTSWRMINLRGGVRQFGFDAKDPAVLYALTGAGLWRSDDRGASWRLAYPDAGAINRIAYTSDEAELVLLANGVNPPSMRAFVVDPSEAGVLYAIFAMGPGNILHVSRNKGKTWNALPGVASERVKRLYVDPNSPAQARNIYAVGDGGIDSWIGGRLSKHPAPFGANVYLTDVAMGFPSGGGAPITYAIWDTSVKDGRYGDGLKVSRDGGSTWETATPAFFGSPGSSKEIPELNSLGVPSNHGEVVYLSYNHVAALGSPYAFGVAKSLDAGRSWELVWKEAPQKPAANIHDGWMTKRFGPEWGESPLALAVHPSNPDICFGTDYGRTMRTLDGGKNWDGVYSRTLPDGGSATTGLDVTTSYEVYFDPHVPNRMFIAYTDIGLFRSENSGDSWSSATTGVPRAWRNTTYAIAFDPEVKDRLWGVMSQVHDLPRVKNFSAAKIAAYKGGVCSSSDGGKTWKQSNTGMEETAPTHILVDPKSPAGARVLYVAAMGKGVYKSADGGRSWSLKRNGLAGTSPMAWRLAQDRNGVLYLVVARQSSDGSYGNEQDGALYRSRDGAETWERVRLPEGLNGPTGIAIDSENPDRLYLSAWGRSKQYAIDPPPQFGGIWISADGGKSWKQTNSADAYLYDVTIDSHDPNLLYTAGFEASVWRSRDRGLNWERVRGFNFHAAHRVTVDPRHPDTIYVTTYGGSVWQGPAAGDPNAPEDIASPSVAYSRAAEIRKAKRR